MANEPTNPPLDEQGDKDDVDPTMMALIGGRNLCSRSSHWWADDEALNPIAEPISLLISSPSVRPPA